MSREFIVIRMLKLLFLGLKARFCPGISAAIGTIALRFHNKLLIFPVLIVNVSI
jgi:hypothetical protein